VAAGKQTQKGGKQTQLRGLCAQNELVQMEEKNRVTTNHSANHVKMKNDDKTCHECGVIFFSLTARNVDPLLTTVRSKTNCAWKTEGIIQISASGLLNY
jgi:hypothetical protein